MNGPLTHIDLFSGIGGFAYAADIVFGEVEHTFCEIDPFCREVLKKHWPGSTIYGDIRELTADSERERLSPEWQKKPKRMASTENFATPDRGYFLITGGFPCQPFSQAGIRRGTDDDRYLWPEMLRVISEFKPNWVVAENVSGLLSIENGMVFEQVCAGLEREGYEVWPFVIPACAVGAPHRRDRVWIVANAQNPFGVRRGGGSEDGGQILEGKSTEAKTARPDSESGDASDTESRRERGGKPERNRSRESEIPTGNDNRNVANPKFKGREESRHKDNTQDRKETEAGLDDRHERHNWNQNWLEVATRLCRMDDGVRTWVDGRGKVRNSRNARLKALGNAIVPQVAIEIFKAIKENQA